MYGFRLSLLPDSQANHRRQYLQGLTLVAVISTFCHTFSHWIAQENLVLLFLVSVILAALYLGEGPTVLVALVSFLMLDFGILNSTLEWGHFDEQYVTSLGIFLFVGLVISNLANRLRRQTEQALEEESHTRALYELSKELARQDATGDITDIFQRHLSQAYGLDVHVYLKGEASASGDLGILGYVAPQEKAALEQAFSCGEATGAGTPHHSYLQATFYPLVTARGVAGAVRLGGRPGGGSRSPAGPERDDSSRLLFQSFCNQVALTLEQVVISDQARRAEVRAETERLQSALLNSISHDLQTPLASISGSLQLLTQPDKLPDEETRQTLLHLASDQTERLRRLVTNLLEITRLEGGGLRLNRQILDADEILDLVVSQAPQLWKERLQIVPPSEYLEFQVDGVLLLSVILNLLENAAKYSPTEQSIELTVRRGQADSVEFCVSDRGAGVPDECKEQIFDRFFRMESHLRAVGSGLGLYVSKGIVQAHGGQLWVEDRPGGGSVFVVRLPAEVPPQDPSTTPGKPAKTNQEEH